MRIRFFNVLLLFLVFSFTTIYSKPYSNYKDLVKDIKSLDYDYEHSATIQGFFFDCSYGELYLDNGTFYPFQALNSKSKGGVFIGSGTFSFLYPYPNVTEKKEYFDKENKIEDEIEWALIFSCDSSESDIASLGTALKDAPKLKSTYMDYLLDNILKSNSEIINIELSYSLLENKSSKHKYYIIKLKNKKYPIAYVFNPNEIDNVQLFILNSSKPSPLCYIYKKPEDSEKEIKHDKPFSYNITLDFASASSVDVSAIVDVPIYENETMWIPCFVPKYCDIDEITIDGIELEYLSFSEKREYLIKLPKEYNKNEHVKLEFKYSYKSGKNDFHEDIFGVGWYPIFNFDAKSIFEINAKYDNDYTFIAVGKNIDTKEEDGKIYSKWKTEPIYNNCFSLGEYCIDSLNLKNDKNVLIYTYGKSKTNYLKNEAKNAFDFYEKLLGTGSFSEINLVENFGWRVDAFNSIINFKSEEINTDPNIPFYKRVIPYYFARLYWYNGFFKNTGSDMWMFESLSIYSSFLYAMIQNYDSKAFLSVLDFYKQSLIKENDKKYFTINHNLGNSINVKNYSFNNIDYIQWLYNLQKRGVWVFHMIRSMLLNLDDMNEDMFVKFLREIYNKSQTKSITVEELRSTLEEQLGVDFKWFFDQWVNTNDIPHYQYAYKIEERAGKQIVKVRVKQSKVSPNFKMIVPISIVKYKKANLPYKKYNNRK